MRVWPRDFVTLAITDVRIYGEQIGGWRSFDKLGSDCSGSDGATNRVLTLTNTQLTTKIIVFKEGTLLHPNTDYTVSHKDSGTTITFLGKVWNSQKIDGIYV